MVPPDGGHHPGLALLLAAAIASGCQAPASPAPTPIQVGAAADLSRAFPELGKLFETRTGQKVTFSFAASGALAKQVSQGAPFDLFAAADTAFVDSAVSAGACDGDSKARYAVGHLVVWTKPGRAPLASLSELEAPQIKHIAIANPEHAPYGKAAREVLTRTGLGSTLQSKIVHAENVRQALQFAQTGNADAAIIALSLVNQDPPSNLLQVDAKLHEPIEQALVVCRHGKNPAGGRAFAKLVTSAEGQALLERYGLGRSVEQIPK